MWLGGAISDYWSLDLGPVSLLVTWNGYTPVLEGGVGFHRTCSFFVQQPDLFALMGQVKSQISNFFPWSASRNDRFFLNLSPHHRRLFISRREWMNSKESLLRRYTFFSTFLLWILSVWWEHRLSLFVMLSFTAFSINSTVSLFFYILHSLSPQMFQSPSVQHLFSYSILL